MWDLLGFWSYILDNFDFVGVIVNVGFGDCDVGKFYDYFFKKYKIYIVFIKWEGINGVCIIFNVYMFVEDLDCLVFVIKDYVCFN